MELKRCNAIADVETFLKTLPADKIVTVWSNSQYYFVEEGQLLLPNNASLYIGEAGRFSLLEMY